MVVTQNALSSDIGVEILDMGGNAVDAAVAVGFSLATTLPRAGNIGGGGFMLIYLKEKNEIFYIDYRSKSPRNSSIEKLLGRKKVPNRDSKLWERLDYTYLASAVPGTVYGLLEAHKNFGKLELKQIMEPVIKQAEEGIIVSSDLSYVIEVTPQLKKDKESYSIFFNNGEALKEFSIIKRPDLANTFKEISKNGAKGFYEGVIADKIVDAMQKNGGLITHDDLKNYKVVERKPVCGEYKTQRICAMPPPSSGGVHLIQMLNMLENFELEQLGHNSAAYIHVLVEVMKRAYADRSAYLGDPDYYDVPIDSIIDKSYAKKLASKINLSKSTKSSSVFPGLGIDVESLSRKRQYRESEETTHFSVWDSSGNVVSNTTTLNFSYGSGISVSGGGFLLNNEMDDFSSKPGAPNGFGLLGGTANEIEPGKRPLSSMTPTIVFDPEGSPILATGSPGGSTIITIVLQILLNVMEFNMGVAEASSVPRIHHQWFPDRLYLESGVSEDTKTLLRNMGHEISSRTRIMGSTQSIQKGPNNFLFGKSDPRRQGAGEAIQD